MTTYLVDGMTCQGCVNAVTNAIKNQIADADVSVELEGGKVTVVGGEQHQIAAAIEDAGFEFKGLA